MKQNIFFKAVVGVTLLASSFLSSAALITSSSGTGTVNAITLSESFESFYNFGNGNTWSSNTGLEMANTLIAFVAEFNNESALFMIFSGPTGDAGNVAFNIVGSEGAIGFVDDPNNDPVVGSQVSLTYAAGKTDGIIFEGLTSDDWSVDVTFGQSSDTIGGIAFLTFDDQGTSSILFETELADFSLSSVAQEVSAPGVLAFLALGISFVAYRKKF